MAKTHKELLADVPQPAREAIETIKAKGNRVEVLGEFKDGQLNLNSDAVAEFARKYPDARFSFVAVNAPFAGKAAAA
jgi:hypothetical protein